MFSADGKPLRVAAYCRVSTDGADQKNSFESQKRYFREYIARHAHWESGGIYADEGISGTSTAKRKAFLQMMADAEKRCFDLIVTKEISRFARNLLDSIYYTRELKRFGIGVFFIADNLFTLDGDAELRLSILASLAQEESRRISERVKWGQTRRMEQGVVFGRSLLGYTVKNGCIAIEPHGAALVRRIFALFANEGLSVTQIAALLDREGIKPMRAEKWSPSVILRMLGNEKYRGDLKQKKTYTPDYLSHGKKKNRGEENFIILHGHHAPIVDEDLFARAAARLASGKKRFAGGKYPYSGKCRCGICGGLYTARFQTAQDGTVYRFWRCNGAPHGGRTCIHNETITEMLASIVADAHAKDEAILGDRLATAVIFEHAVEFQLYGKRESVRMELE